MAQGSSGGVQQAFEELHTQNPDWKVPNIWVAEYVREEVRSTEATAMSKEDVSSVKPVARLSNEVEGQCKETLVAETRELGKEPGGEGLGGKDGKWKQALPIRPRKKGKAHCLKNLLLMMRLWTKAGPQHSQFARRRQQLAMVHEGLR